MANQTRRGTANRPAGADDPDVTEPVDPDVTDNDTANVKAPDPHAVPDEAELDARERELKLRERELALAERERQLAARESAVAEEVDTGPPGLPEYLLVLANGESVESPNALSTHHGGADGQEWPVVAAYPIPGKWGVPYAKHPDNPDVQRRAS